MELELAEDLDAACLDLTAECAGAVRIEGGDELIRAVVIADAGLVDLDAATHLRLRSEAASDDEVATDDISGQLSDIQVADGCVPQERDDPVVAVVNVRTVAVLCVEPDVAAVERGHDRRQLR